jgi:hypothetical protein
MSHWKQPLYSGMVVLLLTAVWGAADWPAVEDLPEVK